MSFKTLFDKANTVTALANKNSTQIGGEVESRQYHTQDMIHEKRFIPRVDYSNPKNFARYGSAEDYYAQSIGRVLDNYPYDGSLKERLEWENNSTYLDLHILDNLYPRTNGYVLFSQAGWGTRNGDESDDGYGLPNNLEYIYLEGGPHGNPTGPTPYPQQFTGSNYYDPGTNRESNLKFDLQNQGATIEFWLKKDAWASSLTTKEVLFDMEANDTGIELNRFRVALNSADDGNSPFLVTALSGGVGILDSSLGSSVTIADGLWHHYAVTLKSGSAGIETKLYIDGGLNVSSVLGSIGINEVTGALVATVGSLVAATDDGGDQYAGKLSGSLDEMRYWKTRRTGEKVGRYWFDQVGGGTNTDPGPFTDTQEEINTTLGVYYKFNEGITGETSLDSVVLDYSGRVTNGAWTGYTAASRSTGSAIVISKAAIKEFKDPIIYGQHPEVIALQASLQVTGSDHDSENAAMVYKSIPGWITEEDEESTGNLKKLTQIMGSYFDTLQIQTDSLNKLKDVEYVSGSNKPIPFASHLLSSHGFVSPEVFLDADVLEQLADRSEDKLYEKSLNDLKNIIYQNIYNNLTYIYKSKGTEKSFRNLIRCFGVDDELIKLQLYAKNTGYEFRDNRRTTILPTKYVDFNTPDNIHATVFAYKDPFRSNANAYGFLTSSVSLANGFAYTFETDVYFPLKKDITNPTYANTNTLSSSLFGIHGTQGSETDTSWPEDDRVNFQVLAIRDELDSPNVKFVLTGTAGGFVPRLESDLYEDTYSDVTWNLSTRVKPERYPLTDFADGADTTNYIIELHGIKVQSGEVTETFNLTGTITEPPEGFMTGSRRPFVGAHRTNFTGSLLQASDVKIEASRFWLNYVEDEALLAHALDSENHGAFQPHKYAYPFRLSDSFDDVIKFDTLAFNWEFSENTGSNEIGQFVVADESSGSADTLTAYNGLGELLNKQYTALGYGFPSSSTTPIVKDFTVISRLNSLEVIGPAETINVLSAQDQHVFKIDSRPVDYFFSFEKSMYNTISEEMVNYFGTLKDFNSLVGAPVNRYRTDYKSLTFLRQKFFEKVGNSEIDFDKFYEFYKWFDSTLSFMLGQLVPASADFSENIRTLVESHALERNKYKNILPFLDHENTVFEATLSSSVDYGDAISSPDDDPQGTGFYPVHAPTQRATGLSARALIKKWKYVHAPPDADQTKKYLWWKNKAERNTPSIEVPSDILATRAQILSSVKKANDRDEGKPYRFNIAGAYTLQGVGTSYNRKPNMLYPAITTHGSLRPGTNAPENLAFITGSAVEALLNTTDEFFPTYKQRLGFIVDLDKNKNSDNPDEPSGLHIAPFSLYHSSLSNVPSEFRENTSITNLHHDFVADNSIPAQGPFTEKYVGGRQFRHIDLNTGTDTALTRAEGFKLQFTEVSSAAGGKFSGSLVILPPDSTGLITRSDIPTAQRLRSETAKRPVNIKNIFMTTASAGTRLDNIAIHGKIGNYQKNYEVIQTAGRTQNDPYFIEQSFNFALYPETTATRGRFLGVLNDASTGNTGGTLNYTLPTRTGPNSNQTIIVNRFSAPGGYQVNSRGYMDPAHEELSVYNALPYRNRGVIDYGMSGSASADPSIAQAEHVVDQLLHARGLNQRATLHCGPFGTDAAYGSVTATSTRVDDGLGYSVTPSWHKTNRNTLRRIEATETGYITGSVYDNLYVQHQIPQSTQQYAWITASLAPGESITGLQPPTCISASSLQLLTASGVGYSQYASHVPYLVYGATVRGGFNASSQGLQFLPVDFLGLSTIVVDPVSASTHTLGYSLDLPLYTKLSTYYANSDYINSSTMPLQPVLGDGNIITNVANGAPGYASILNSILNNRNGPYGYPTWKQIRTGETRVAQALRRQNKIGTLRPPPMVPNVVSSTGQELGFVRAKQSNEFVDFTEQPLSSRHYPIFVATEDNTTGSDVRNNIILHVTYGNKLDAFSNEGFNNLLNIPAPNLYDNAFSSIVQTILGGPLDAMVNYSERIYPAEVNVYKNIVRNRTTFTISDVWNSDRDSRSTATRNNSQGDPIPLQSVWPLDPNINFSETPPELSNREDGSGELQNIYSRFGVVGAYGDGDISASALYSSRIPVGYTGGATSSANIVYGGATAFATPEQSGKVPYERYEDWVQLMRLIGKDHSIIPEFRLSELLETYLGPEAGNFLGDVGEVLTLTGSDSQISNTSENFYKTYTNADFMKYFEVVDNMIDQQRSNELKMQRDKLSLRCSALLKFLPYKGFYPAERMLELATLFSSSYGDAIETVATMPDAIEAANKVAYRALMEPLFAPGIWFNTVKSGVGVGSWVMTQTRPEGPSADIAKSGQQKDAGVTVLPEGNVCFGAGSLLSASAQSGADNYYFQRIPFEASYRPEEFLSEMAISGSYIWDTGIGTGSLAFNNGNKYIKNKAKWNGSGKELYRLAADNFLCETSNFFMQDMASFVSSPENQFSEDTQEGEVFALTLNFNRPTTIQSGPVAGGSADRSRFELYNRASAFGPPFILDEGYPMSVAGASASGSIELTSSLISSGVQAVGFIELTASSKAGPAWTITSGDRWTISDGGTNSYNYLQPGTVRTATFAATSSGDPCSYDGCFEIVNTGLGNENADILATLQSFYDTVNTYQAANPSFKVTSSTISYGIETPGTGVGRIFFMNSHTGAYGNVGIIATTSSNGDYYQRVAGMGSGAPQGPGGGQRTTYTAGTDPVYTLTDQDRFVINDGGCDGEEGAFTFYLTGAVSGSSAWDTAAASASPFAELTCSNASSSAMQLMDAINARANYGTFSITASLTGTPTAANARINIVNGLDGGCGNEAITATTSSDGNTYINLLGLAGGEDATTLTEYSASLTPNLPSYFYGTSSVTIITSASYSGRQTIGELFGNAEYIYDRSYENGNFDQAAAGYWFAQQVSESINLSEVFAEGESFRWAIQSKFETPVLNFADVTVASPAAALYTMRSGCPTSMASKGMWHQYGVTPTDGDGIYMNITTPTLVESTKYGVVVNPSSLAQMVGFQEGINKEIGKTKDEQVLEEAVVAVPFVIANNRRKFISFPRKRPASYTRLVDAMQKYVFPPKFDFLQFKSVLPVVMYVFEFSMDLKKQDLTDMWQNLAPGDETPKMVVEEVIVEDKNLINKMLSDDKELQWMVFKVKKRANKDFEIQRRLQLVSETNQITPSIGHYSYNWPYDYFSLVELAKISETVQYISQGIVASISDDDINDE